MKNELIAKQNNNMLDYDNLKDIEKHIETYKKYLNIANATKEDIAFFSQYCQRTQLDPVSRQIYAISSTDRNGKPKIQVLLSIDGYRIIAQRTGEFEGVETYWCGADGVWKDVWLDNKNPSASKVIVYKKGSNKGISAVALFKEYANLRSQTWQKMPALMIAKCAESLALRKAFPSALSGLYTTEEMSNTNIVDTQADTVNTIDNSRYDIDTNTYLIDDSEQYSIVPSGNNKGKKWEDCDIGVLSKALEYYNSKSPNMKYCKVIKPILELKLSVCEEKQDKGVKWADMETEKLEDYYNRYKSGKLIGFAEERANYIEKILLERNIENTGYMYPSSDDKDDKKENKKVADVEVSEDENPFEVDYDEDWDGDMGMNKEDKDEEGLFQ